MKKTKTRGNGEGTIYYNEKRKCWIAQITVGKTSDGKLIRPTVSGKTKKEVLEKIKELRSTQYVPKTQLTLIQFLEQIQEEKLKANLIKENTYYRNQFTLKQIRTSSIGNIPIQEITASQIQEFLNEDLDRSSQSDVDKRYDMLSGGFEKAFIDEIILKNPMLKVTCPQSHKKRKKAEAFEVFEQKNLMDYITTHPLLPHSTTLYDEESIRNLIFLGFLTGMRIGELGAIDFEKHINFEQKLFSITRTLTKDKTGKIILGTETKTGTEKIIPFNIFNIESIQNILENQISLAKSNPNNINNLLFCKKNGDCIVHTEINQIFKRICREARVKLELEKGCHFHMTRHTFATRAIEARLEEMTIAKLLGHSSTKQLEKTYGHVLDKFRDEQLNDLNTYYQHENITILQEFKKAKHLA